MIFDTDLRIQYFTQNEGEFYTKIVYVWSRYINIHNKIVNIISVVYG